MIEIYESAVKIAEIAKRTEVANTQSRPLEIEHFRLGPTKTQMAFFSNKSSTAKIMMRFCDFGEKGKEINRNRPGMPTIDNFR